MSHRIVFVVNILIVLALIVFSIVVYSDLPDQIPTHIDYSGKADSTTEKNIFIWMAIPFLSVALLIVFSVIAGMIDKTPKWVNVPHKKLYLALSENMRKAINQYIKAYLLITGFMVNVILFEVQLMLYQSASNSEGKANIFNVYFLYFFAGVFLIYVFVYLFKFSQMIKTAWLAENPQGN